MNTPRKMAFTGTKESSQSRYKTTCMLIILILFSVFRVLSILSRYSFSQVKKLQRDYYLRLHQDQEQRQNERDLKELQHYQREINTYLGKKHEDI